MGDYVIQMVPDKDEDGNPNVCYLNATMLAASYLLLASAISMLM